MTVWNLQHCPNMVIHGHLSRQLASYKTIVSIHPSAVILVLQANTENVIYNILLKKLHVYINVIQISSFWQNCWIWKRFLYNSSKVCVGKLCKVREITLISVLGLSRNNVKKKCMRVLMRWRSKYQSQHIINAKVSKS